MTTKEFINYVKQYGETAFIDNGYIKVYTSLWVHILSVSVNEINKLECVDTVGGDGCIAMGILKGAIEYAETPIKDRDEESSKSERFYLRTNNNGRRSNRFESGYLNKSENGYFISDDPLESFNKEELDEIDKDPYINLAEYSYVLEKVK